MPIRKGFFKICNILSVKSTTLASFSTFSDVMGIGMKCVCGVESRNSKTPKILTLPNFGRANILHNVWLPRKVTCFGLQFGIFFDTILCYYKIAYNIGV